MTNRSIKEPGRCPRCDVWLEVVGFKGEVVEFYCWQCGSRVIMRVETLAIKREGDKPDDLPPFDFDVEPKGGDFIDTVPI